MRCRADFPVIGSVPLLALLACVAFAQSPDPMARAIDAFTNRRYAEAERYLKQAVRQQPRSFDAHFLYGAALVELDRSDEAIPELEQAHRLNPAHADAMKLLAVQYMMHRDYAKAIALLRPVAVPDEETYLLLIESHQASGDSARSFAAAQRAVERFPKSAQLHCWIGFQLQFSGRYEEARKHLEEAIRLAPDYPATYYVLGDVLLKELKYEAAAPYFEKAIQFLPEDVDAWIGLSQAWLGLDNLPKAIAALEDAARAVPQDSRIHLNLSRLFFRMGDQAKAEQEAARSIQLREKEGAAAELPAALRSVH